MSRRSFERKSCKKCKEQFLILLKKKGSGLDVKIAKVILGGDKEKISLCFERIYKDIVLGGGRTANRPFLFS